MRKYWKHGRNHTMNQIVVRSDNYTTFQLGGHAWIKIPSLQKRKRIANPLNTTLEPTGTLRLILKDGEVKVHYTIEVAEAHNCGKATIGIDKGYTEVFVDFEGKHYGESLGKLLTKHSDRLKKNIKPEIKFWRLQIKNLIRSKILLKKI